MKNRILSVILCALIICIQAFWGVGIVHAEGQVEILAELDNGMLSIIGEKSYVAPLGKFGMSYYINNTGYQDISNIEIIEELQDKSGKVIIPDPISPDLISVDVLQPGAKKTLRGSSFSGELESSPYMLIYHIKYKQVADDQWQEITGQNDLSVLDTRLDVVYKTQQAEPIFKGEQVTFIAEVESKANVTLYNITVSDSVLGELGTIDALAPGDKKIIEKTIALNKTTEGHINLTYDDPMGIRENITQELFNSTLKINVNSEAAISSLTFTGSPDKAFIPGEETVTFSLKLKNTGNTSLINLECKDWEGKVFSTYEKLLPNEEITVEYTGIIQPDTSYDLLAQAAMEGSTQIIQSAYNIKLQKLDPRAEIERTITPELVKPGEPFTIKYLVRNTGNVTLNDLILEEPEFGEITRFDSIEAGREVTYSKELTIDKSGVSRTILTAKVAEMDTEYRYEAADLEIPMEVIGEKNALSIVLKSDVDSLKKPGTIELECIIKNTGTEPLYNLAFTLMDREIPVDNIAVLEPGEEKTIKILPFRIEETEKFTVRANGFDVDQEAFSISSEPLTIEIGAGNLSGKNSVLRVILIVIILLSISIIGALIYLTRGHLSQRYRRKHKTTNTRPM